MRIVDDQQTGETICRCALLRRRRSECVRLHHSTLASYRNKTHYCFYRCLTIFERNSCRFRCTPHRTHTDTHTRNNIETTKQRRRKRIAIKEYRRAAANSGGGVVVALLSTVDGDVIGVVVVVVDEYAVIGIAAVVAVDIGPYSSASRSACFTRNTRAGDE